MRITQTNRARLLAAAAGVSLVFYYGNAPAQAEPDSSNESSTSTSDSADDSDDNDDNDDHSANDGDDNNGDDDNTTGTPDDANGTDDDGGEPSPAVENNNENHDTQPTHEPNPGAQQTDPGPNVTNTPSVEHDPNPGPPPPSPVETPETIPTSTEIVAPKISENTEAPRTEPDADPAPPPDPAAVPTPKDATSVNDQPGPAGNSPEAALARMNDQPAALFLTAAPDHTTTPSAGTPHSLPWRSQSAASLFVLLGFPLLGGGPTTPANPASWTLLWWVRRHQHHWHNEAPALDPSTPTSDANGHWTGDLNGTDRDDDPITYMIVSEPGRGTVTIHSDGTYTYTPDPDFAAAGGTDQFVVAASDGAGRHHHHFAIPFWLGHSDHSTTSTVTVVLPAGQVNTDPIATQTGPTVTDSVNGTISGSVLFDDPDGDTVTTGISGVLPGASPNTYTTAKGGTLTWDPTTGSYTYTPTLAARIASTLTDATDEDRTDTFVLTADDGNGGVTPVTVTVPITSPYSSGQLTVPGSQVDETVIDPDGNAYITTHANDISTWVTVVRPDGTTVTTAPIAGGPSQGIHGVVFSPYETAYQVTTVSTTVAHVSRSQTTITRIASDGTVTSSEPIVGYPEGDLQFDEIGKAYLPTSQKDVVGGPTYTYVTVVDPDGTITTSEPVVGQAGRLVMTDGHVYVAATDDDGTRLYEIGENAELTLLAQLLDGIGGFPWTENGGAIYFGRNHGDPAVEPVATFVVWHPDGTMSPYYLPGWISSVQVNDAGVAHVTSSSSDTVYLSAVDADDHLMTVVLPGASNGIPLIGPDGKLYAAIRDDSTGETTVVVVAPDGTWQPVSLRTYGATVWSSPNGDLLVVGTDEVGGGHQTTVTTHHADGQFTESSPIAGLPSQVTFDEAGNAYLTVETADSNNVTSVSLAVVTPDGTTRVSEPIQGQSRGEPAIAPDGTAYLALQRFDQQTSMATTILVAVHPDGSSAVVDEFSGYPTQGPTTGSDGDILLVTNEGGRSTIRVVRIASNDAMSGTPNAAPVVDPNTSPSIENTDSGTGAVSGSVAGTVTDDDVLSYLTADPQVELDPDTGGFVFTPTAQQRHDAAATDDVVEHTFSVVVADPSGASTVVAVTVPIDPANEVPESTGQTAGNTDLATGVVSGNLSDVVSDADGDTLTYIGISNGSTSNGGTVTVEPDGTFTYTPTPEMRHAAASDTATDDDKFDTFTVTVDDGHGGLEETVVTVAVAPANESPSTTTEVAGTGTVTGTQSQ